MTGDDEQGPGDTKRVHISLRLAPDLKQRLDEAARERGRSLTQEAEYRLQQSFDMAAHLAGTASMMIEAANNTLIDSGLGGPGNLGLFLTMAHIIGLAEQETGGKSWREDDQTRRVVADRLISALPFYLGFPPGAWGRSDEPTINPNLERLIQLSRSGQIDDELAAMLTDHGSSKAVSTPDDPDRQDATRSQ